MSLVFPSINANGVITQRPYRSGVAYNSAFQDSAYGRPYSFLKRGSGLNFFPVGPLGRFWVNYLAITDAEIQVLANFFSQANGRLSTFSFTDPETGVVFTKCRFDTDDFSYEAIGPNQNSISLPIVEHN